MSKQSLLLVDGDTRSLRVLEVSLRKVGFTVTTAETVQDALEKLEVHQPDLIVSETAFQDGDGFELRRRVRATPDWGDIPFIFLTAEQAIENKIRGLELGVDDYLTKPIYIKEIITRINILLQKRQRARFEERRDGRTRFAGRISDMPVIDVIQTIEISRKSGVIQFVGERSKQATIYFRDGRVIDAEAGALQGEDAVYRLLTWSDGEFEVVFRTVRRREVIQTSSQGLLMEGMRRLDEWSRILEQLPPLSHRFEVDTVELALRLGDVPDDNNRILRLIDGKRTLFEVIDGSDVGDLECLQAIARLYFEGIMHDLDHSSTERKRDTGRQQSMDVGMVPTPIEEVASGPVTAAHFGELEEEARREASGPRTIPDAPITAPHVAPLPLKDTQPTDLSDVISEEDEPPLEPLSGGYRPSSLRLIDEAVAAAQALEPSLFAGLNDIDDAPLEPDSIPPKASNDPAIPHEIEADELSAPAPPPKSITPRTTKPARPELPPLKQDSSLRMIGSLGRDRAETSGELRPSAAMAAATGPETARELITILPRRSTRELPIVVPVVEPATAAAIEPPSEQPPAKVAVEPKAVPDAAALVTSIPVPTARAGIERAITTSDRTTSATSTRPPADRAGPRPPEPKPDEPQGPGPGAIAMIAIAVVLTLLAVYLKVRKHPKPEHPVAVLSDSAVPLVAPPIDAAVHVDAPGFAPDAAPVDAHLDATTLAVAPIDAPAAPLPDASAVAAAPIDAGVGAGSAAVIDPAILAKLLADQANAAIAESNAARALELADQSLKLRKTAKTYLIRAAALQRLERVSDAVDAIDLAIDILKRSGKDTRPAWEQKGRTLLAAGRKDEARVAFQHFLDLEPEGSADAARIRKFMESK